MVDTFKSPFSYLEQKQQCGLVFSILADFRITLGALRRKMMILGIAHGDSDLISLRWGFGICVLIHQVILIQSQTCIGLAKQKEHAFTAEY